jgi:hypothetical protein
VEHSEHVKHEDKQQYRPEPQSGATAGTPSRVTVIAPASAKNQQQDDDEYDHCVSTFLLGFLLFRALLLKYLFNLTDLLPDSPADFLSLTFGRQIGVVRDLARFLFHCAFHFVKRARRLVRCALFHGFSFGRLLVDLD